MNKTAVFLILLCAIPLASFASEIKVAPFAVYDSDGNKAAPPVNPSKAVHAELEKHWFEGLVNFSRLSESEAGTPVTIIEANKICESLKADYLLYGYIKKNETSWMADIKLYDAAKKKIAKEFFASDGADHYDRMLDVLCRNILSGIEETTGLNQDELKKEKTRPMELNVATSLFYWSPIDGGWGNKILGIAGVNAGLEFYPPQPIVALNGKLIDFSAKLNLMWDIGVNKKGSYPLVINSMAISLPAFMRIHFTERHSTYVGLGLSYGIEFMSIRPKYEEKQFLHQNAFSFESTVGYEFNLNELVNLFAEITFDWHLAGDGFVSVRPGLGASFNVFKERK